jgi:hypothetical protein
MLASIKYLGQCPCPRCLVRKDQISALGTKLDSRRRDQIREDDMSRQENVEMTRGWIFEKGYRVLSAAVGRILSAMSLVPTRVCIFYVSGVCSDCFCRMPSRIGCLNSVSIFIRCL